MIKSFSGIIEDYTHNARTLSSPIEKECENLLNKINDKNLKEIFEKREKEFRNQFEAAPLEIVAILSNIEAVVIKALASPIGKAGKANIILQEMKDLFKEHAFKQFHEDAFNWTVHESRLPFSLGAGWKKGDYSKIRMIINTPGYLLHIPLALFQDVVLHTRTELNNMSRSRSVSAQEAKDYDYDKRKGLIPKYVKNNDDWTWDVLSVKMFLIAVQQDLKNLDRILKTLEKLSNQEGFYIDVERMNLI